MATSARVRLYSLDPAIAGDLSSALSTLGVSTVRKNPQVVFCPAAPGILRRALRRFPRLPVVVVSRLPDVAGWLDALEAGAADYCSAPFESIHLNWILQSQLRGGVALA
jgi:hypothetical protein